MKIHCYLGGAKTAIVQAVLNKGADYLLALKDNQPSLAGEVELFFADPTRCPEAFETIDADHGRIETRRHFVSHDGDWLASDRRFPGEPRFPGLEAIAMVESIIESKVTGKITKAKRYFISSLDFDPSFCAKAVRAHWSIETIFTGFSMSFSTMTSCDCAPKTDRKTWAPSNTRHSISSKQRPAKKATGSNKKPQLGMMTSSKLSSISNQLMFKRLP